MATPKELVAAQTFGTWAPPWIVWFDENRKDYGFSTNLTILGDKQKNVLHLHTYLIILTHLSKQGDENPSSLVFFLNKPLNPKGPYQSKALTTSQSSHRLRLVSGSFYYRVRKRNPANELARLYTEWEWKILPCWRVWTEIWGKRVRSRSKRSCGLGCEWFPRIQVSLNKRKCLPDLPSSHSIPNPPRIPLFLLLYHSHIFLHHSQDYSALYPLLPFQHQQKGKTLINVSPLLLLLLLLYNTMNTEYLLSKPNFLNFRSTQKK